MKYSVKYASVMLFALLLSLDLIAQVNSGNEIELPFNNSEYQTDGNYFRAVQSGESSAKATSKKIALINARAELASIISVHVNRVIHSYVKEKVADVQGEFDSVYYVLSSERTAQLLTNVNIIGEKLYLDDEGNYTTWLAIEMKKDDVLNHLDDSIKLDSLNAIDVHDELFRNLFNEKNDNQ